MADYVGMLRKKVGTDPLILCGTNVIIRNKKGEILLHHRRDRDWWGLPGGFMELGESLQENAIRETQEEVGLICHNLKLFNVYSGKNFFYQYPDGNQVQNVTATFLCDEYEGDLVVDQTEGRDAKFFSLEALPQAISSTIWPILKEYINY